MGQVINTNILSLTAQRNLSESGNALQTSLERLSSGLRINSAADDAAGLAISERFTTQIRGLDQAQRNANDGISLAQTGEGALSTIGENLQRIRELGVQAINDTNSASDRQAINNEVQQLIAEVNRVASSTQFNGQNILDGSSSSLTFQVGANQNQTIQVNGVDSRGSQLGARLSESGSISQTNLDASIAADDLVINGTSIDLSGLAAGDSTNDVVQAINAQQADTGVQALAANSVSTGDIAGTFATTTADTDDTFSLNSVTITAVSAQDTTTAIDVQATVDNINALSTQTGVTATTDGSGSLELANTSGQRIELEGNAVTDETFNAGVTLASEVQANDFGATGTFAVVAGGTALGDSQTNDTLNGVNVVTGSNANDALLTLDFALQQVTGLRAELGAVQTRFESTISNLAVVNENLQAARSRIQDADFAAETANLTRAQILQQAGTSVLSQANAAPQNVLALLN